jgi:Domain of unknown function (DUF4132)
VTGAAALVEAALRSREGRRGHRDDEIRAWRQLLTGRQLIQPVKQAFREVYVLTPAEEETGDYSNRFAGHIFRQAQAVPPVRRRPGAERHLEQGLPADRRHEDHRPVHHPPDLRALM